MCTVCECQRYPALQSARLQRGIAARRSLRSCPVSRGVEVNHSLKTAVLVSTDAPHFSNFCNCDVGPLVRVEFFF